MKRVFQQPHLLKGLAATGSRWHWTGIGCGHGLVDPSGHGLVDLPPGASSPPVPPMEEEDPLSAADQVTVEMAKQLSIRKRPPRGAGIDELLHYNEDWSAAIKKVHPRYFKELSKVQSPQYLWIGCSDSRVPANQIVGLAPGEVFVHRNVANVVARADLNCLSVMQFAIHVLKVEHIIVCGHYGCGGVIAAHEEKRFGLVDNWIMHVGDVMRKYQSVLDRCEDHNKINALCELNVIAQFNNVVDTHVVRDWWRMSEAHKVDIHGWCYGLDDGLVKPLVSISRGQKLDRVIEDAVNAVERKWRGPMGP